MDDEDQLRSGFVLIQVLIQARIKETIGIHNCALSLRVCMYVWLSHLAEYGSTG